MRNLSLRNEDENVEEPVVELVEEPVVEEPVVEKPVIEEYDDEEEEGGGEYVQLNHVRPRLHANRLSVSRCALHLLREFENNRMRI